MHTVAGVEKEESPQELNDVIPEVDMSGLTSEQQEVVQKMLKEEAASFAKNEDDIGCIEGLHMGIDLSDSTPVQRNYVSIPRPLYQEVKSYIEDLLNKQFITRSRSSYSSPVVCVRKKDGTLRLCVDYRELNHRIQETLDSLGGNSWFSVLVQGKAYHQGFFNLKVDPTRHSSRHGDYTNGYVYRLA